MLRKILEEVEQNSVNLVVYKKSKEYSVDSKPDNPFKNSYGTGAFKSAYMEYEEITYNIQGNNEWVEEDEGEDDNVYIHIIKGNPKEIVKLVTNEIKHFDTKVSKVIFK